jgi:uncharacterized protein GlcG (DUF336 family)
VIGAMRAGLAATLVVMLLGGCGGGGGGGGGSTPAPNPATLTVADVQQVIAQAVAEAQAQQAKATIAVVDRVGNVLGVFRMNGAALTFTISSGRGVVGGLEGLAILPSELAAIAKAITGAYLSSQGNAFTTRTAGQIIQQNFNPGESNQPSGPLFGVQFSQLSCSDVNQHAAAGTMIGPKRSPLGLAADPGGLPLYKNGTLVGGVGVISDAIYGIDSDIQGTDADNDELIAVAGGTGFGAPGDQRANRITVDGRTLRYTDSESLASNPAVAPAFGTINGTTGMLINVGGYGGDPIVAGVAFGTPASGVRPDTNPAFAGMGAYVLVDAANLNRYPPTPGSLLTQAEVTQVLKSALAVANRARAQIRRPLGSAAEVTVSVVDTDGAVLGLVRTPDAPLFGSDVAVQKARTAAFFSSVNAAALLLSLPPAQYPTLPPTTSSIAAYVPATQQFLGDPAALANGIAYGNRPVGNIARPYFPDGIDGTANGPLSKPFASWSVFNDGLQLDLVANALVASLAAGDDSIGCTGLSQLINGIQIFPGSVPIYRGGQLAGAIGVSGDGIDQDDMIAFLGLANAGSASGSGMDNAPTGIRADAIVPQGTGTRLRYVNCPQAPFNDSTDQNVCAGL